MSTAPRRPRGGPRLVDPELAARVPGLRRVAAVALVLAALSAVAVVVQAVALASVVERSLLHHESVSQVAPALVLVGRGRVGARRAGRGGRAFGARARPNAW